MRTARLVRCALLFFEVEMCRARVHNGIEITWRARISVHEFAHTDSNARDGHARYQIYALAFHFTLTRAPKVHTHLHVCNYTRHQVPHVRIGLHVGLWPARVGNEQRDSPPGVHSPRHAFCLPRRGTPSVAPRRRCHPPSRRHIPHVHNGRHQRGACPVCKHPPV
jgi:hypothetical protein